MFNIGAGEITLILVVALLVLGPQRLPELARGMGKFLRAFRRQTDEVRSVIEREFYRMDQDVADFKADFDLSKPHGNALKAPGQYDDQGHPLPPPSSQANEGLDIEGTQVMRPPLEETPTQVAQPGAHGQQDEVTQVQERSLTRAPALDDQDPEDPLGRDRDR